MEKELLQSVRVLRGMGEKRAKSMEKLEIRTLFDLISYFPRDYEDRTQIKAISALTPDEAACVCATVLAPPELRHIRRGMDITQVRAGDESGTITLTFFNQNRAFARRNLCVLRQTGQKRMGARAAKSGV